MADVTGGRGGSDFAEGRHRRLLVGDDVPAGCPMSSRPRDGRREWLVSGYSETREFLRDKRFSRAVLAETTHPRGPATRMSVTDLDPPRHTRIRKLIGGAFSARRAEQLRGYVETAATDLLDRLIAAGPTADLLTDFCAPLTFSAQAELLGVPRSRRDAVRKRANARLGKPGSPRSAVYQGELLLHDEVAMMLADTEDPPSGLMAELVEAHRSGALDESELTGLAASLFFDGHALAAAQITNTVLCVISRPGLLAELDSKPAVLDATVEEALRYSPAVNFSMTRIATEDVALAGTRIEPGDLVTALLPVVNRDEGVFAEPDRFAMDRNGRHLSFGHGTHHCIGAHLARVEIQSALRALSRRAPELSLAVPESSLDWTVSPTMRALSALPVRWSSSVVLDPLERRERQWEDRPAA
ncbi:cytochrome P450 [Amycolatopsis sp. WAC 01416]|uniref:cytochrome P450 n=1 Tax=Amycolatopsis sp. WAC 01416 TaxID=2203196 RepID=UPI000F7B849C|nr:cytochrome P450 [Amycolatopsis sp. WAC 01416]RSN32168.1 cytochrome P450 [Amycolatopsis sp. WAC 01416]